MKREHLADYVLSIPDFPEKGVIFRDITSLIQDPDGLKDSVDGLIRSLKDVDFDLVIGLESRGFIFGTAIAYELHKGTKVVIVDDLIATGGTLEAACKLVERLGGEVAKISVVMELAGLEGRKKLENYSLESLICYEGK